MQSHEIAQQIAEQNQFFMAQSALASQIGASPIYQGLGGYGLMAPQPGMLFPAPGQRRSPQPFHYGMSPMLGYGAGSRVGAMAMGAMSGASALGGAGLAMLSMTRSMAPVAPFVDPFSAFGAARSMGLGIGGGLAAGALVAAPAMAASHMMGSFIHGGQQQSMINTGLGQYNFFNPQSRTGSGFTRMDAQQIGDQVRQLAYIPEMMTSVQELSRLLPKLKDAGLMQGVRDAQEFSKRFKDAVGTIRDVSRILGSTMEEASEFFSHSRRIGMLGKGDQIKNAMGVQLASGLTGMSTGQVMQMQQSGADLATSIGARRATGARAVTNIAQTLGAAQQSGALSQGLLEDITGKVGEDAVQDASMRMANLSVRMAGTAPGRAMIAGMAKFDDNGRAIGIDETLVGRFNRGELGLSEIKGRASRLTNAQKISFMGRQSELAMSFAGQTGAAGVGKLMEQLLGGRGPEAAPLILQRLGATEGESDVAMQLAQNLGSGKFEEQRAMQGAFGGIRMREAAIRERATVGGIWQRLKTRIGRTTTQPFEQAGSEVLTSISKAWDEFIDDAVGRHVVSLSKETATEFKTAFASGNKAKLAEFFGGGSGGGTLPISRSSRGQNLALMGVPIVGPLLANMAGGGRGIGSFIGGLRDTEFGAALSRGLYDTGRTALGQYQHMAGMVGISGSAEDQGVRNQVSDVVKALSGVGAAALVDSQTRSSAKFQEAVAATRGIMNNLGLDDEYYNADDMRKMDMVRSKMQYAHNTWGGSRAIHDMTRLAGGGTNEKMMTAILAEANRGANELGKFNLSATLPDGEFLDVEGRAIASRTAEQTLYDAIGNGAVVSLLKERPDIRKHVLDIESRGGAHSEALMQGSISESVAKLRELGIKVQPEDVSAMRDAYRAIKKNPKKVRDAIGTFETVRRQEGIAALKGAAKNMFKEAEAAVANAGKVGTQMQAYSNALHTFSTANDRGALTESAQAVGTSAVALAEAIRGLSDTEKQKIMEAAPETVKAMVSRMEGVHKRLGNLSGIAQTSAEGIVQSLGLDTSHTETIRGIVGKGFTGKISAAKMAEIERVVGRDTAGNVIGANAKAINSMDKDVQMVQTLKVIAEAVIAGTKDATTKSRLEADLHRAFGENGNATSNGTAAPGASK